MKRELTECHDIIPDFFFNSATLKVILEYLSMPDEVEPHPFHIAEYTNIKLKYVEEIIMDLVKLGVLLDTGDGYKINYQSDIVEKFNLLWESVDRELYKVNHADRVQQNMGNAE